MGLAGQSRVSLGTKGLDLGERKQDVLKIGRPSWVGPVSESTLCSGCGMRPTTLPRSLQMRNVVVGAGWGCR